MIKYTKNMLVKLSNDMSRFASTPMEKNMYEVNQNDEKLDDPKAQIVHHNLAKLFYM